MLNLTTNQLNAIGASRFQERLSRLLRDNLPDSRGVIDTPSGQQTLREQCAKACSYGLKTELNIANYIITAWLLGVDFDTRFVTMKEILSNPELTPSEKSNGITQVTSIVLSDLQKGKR